MPVRERDPTEPGDIAVASAGEVRCDDCGQPFKNAQGLAGHRRLAHSTSTRAELEARETKTAEREAASKRREAELARQVEVARRAEAVLRGREEAVRAAEAIPQQERLKGTAAGAIGRLPEVRTGAILRVNGVDYRLTDNGLVHVYWPKGEKIELEEGDLFRFNGRPYCIRGGSLRPISASAILARLLGEEE